MGTIIKGMCHHCGYSTKNLHYGGGFTDFTTCCNYPVLDRLEKDIKVANIMDKGTIIRQNPNYVFYDDNSLSNRALQIEGNSNQWGDYRVYNSGYFCPKCNNYTLGFEPRGCWD